MTLESYHILPAKSIAHRPAFPYFSGSGTSVLMHKMNYWHKPDIAIGLLFPDNIPMTPRHPDEYDTMPAYYPDGGMKKVRPAIPKVTVWDGISLSYAEKSATFFTSPVYHRHIQHTNHSNNPITAEKSISKLLIDMVQYLKYHCPHTKCRKAHEHDFIQNKKQKNIPPGAMPPAPVRTSLCQMPDSGIAFRRGVCRFHGIQDDHRGPDVSGYVGAPPDLRLSMRRPYQSIFMVFLKPGLSAIVSPFCGNSAAGRRKRFHLYYY